MSKKSMGGDDLVNFDDDFRFSERLAIRPDGTPKTASPRHLAQNNNANVVIFDLLGDDFCESKGEMNATLSRPMDMPSPPTQAKDLGSTAGTSSSVRGVSGVTGGVGFASPGSDTSAAIHSYSNATGTNLYDCQTDSDSDDLMIEGNGTLPGSMYTSYGQAIHHSFKGAEETPLLSRQGSGAGTPRKDKQSTSLNLNHAPDEAALLEAQLHLERAAEDNNTRSLSARSDKRSEHGHQSIVMKNRGAEETVTAAKDPFISGLFSVRTPRDATAGLVSGVKSVSKGVAMGVASLVVCPVVGGHQGGVGGFIKGVGAGMLGAVTLPATGVGVASYQIGRGVVNTPNAICQMAHGKKWDKQTGKWKDDWYSLEEEVKEVMNAVKHQADVVEHDTEQAEHARSPGNSQVEVADTELYEVLGVSTSATQQEIKRQYYKLAKKYHPDKTGDSGSAEKFTKLGEAYQVLGDEERRRMYDQHGKSACDEMPILDSSLLFMMLFGSEEMEPYVGKLRMALYMELELHQRGRIPTEADFEVAQWDREVRVALNLRDAVRPYVCGELEKWYAGLVETAMKLCTNSFTTEIVATIGWTYNNIANRYIGKWDTFMGIGGKVAKFQEQSKSFGKSIKTFTSMFKTAVAERSAQKTRGGEASGMINEEYMRDVCEKSLPAIMDAMLNICLMDIQSTVKKAARRIVKDMGVDQQWRRKRAEGLGLMGRAFMVAAEDAKKRLAAEKQPVSMYDMFAQAAQKVRMQRDAAQAPPTYRTDDGFF
ncbi:dnaJ domain containing protein [Babesia divergens]|uniref:DnaJ domain containing protein n=1 Tax=Babesia divergens TaxID=32595 RepID=A0AAD9G6I3_BABDI|nr:dnaJ domain containing protein [Babesia divergens]